VRAKSLMIPPFWNPTGRLSHLGYLPNAHTCEVLQVCTRRIANMPEHQKGSLRGTETEGKGRDGKGGRERHALVVREVLALVELFVELGMCVARL